MTKRPDIQGLRAVAVLLVIIYHAGLPLPGGFDGVDVFFAISGFVITGTLLSELATSGKIRFSRFYVRRIKRLLPAVALMLAFVAIVGVLADPAGAQRTSAFTGIFTSLFSSNFYLAHLPTGYFAVAATDNSLLHTWTLGVEEQFYIVFPLLLVAGWWLGRKKLGRGQSRTITFALIATACAVSFLISRQLYHTSLFTSLGSPSQLAFYASPARAWEFGVGALVVIATPLLSRLPVWGAYALGTAGAIAIALSAFTLHAATFRETEALLPVGGACLLLAAGVATRVGFSRLLSVRPMVWIGDISYGLYLWHWPLIVFARALWPAESWAVKIAAVAALLPSWLSYRFVENPIRFHSRLGSRSLVAGRTAAALASVCIAVPIFANVGLLQAHNLIDRTATMKSWRNTTALPSSVGRGCESSKALGPGYNPKCTWHVAHPSGTIVLFGDSNAGMYTEPVVKAGNGAGYDVTVATASSCPYVGLRITRIDGEEHNCPGFGSKSIDFMVTSKPSLVVLGARSDFYLQNSQDGLAVVGKGGFTFTNAGKARLYRQALRSTLMRLSAAGVPVLLVHPIPVLPLDQATCAIVRVLLGACSSSLPRSSVDNWLRLAIQTESQGADGVKRVKTIDFENQLCGKTRCSTMKSGVSLYRDSRHLSVDGALTLTGTFQRAIVAHAIPRK